MYEHCYGINNTWVQDVLGPQWATLFRWIESAAHTLQMRKPSPREKVKVTFGLPPDHTVSWW